MTQSTNGKEKLQEQGKIWFDRNIKFRLEDWEEPICSRCQESDYIVTEAFGYGSVYHLCQNCAHELGVAYLE